MRFIITFLEGLGSTLGVGIGTILTFLLCATIGIILIVNRQFFFSFIFAFGDWVVFQLSKIPFFANGTYLSKIRKNKAAIKEIRELQKELEGQKQDLLSDYQKNKAEFEKATSRAQYLKQSGSFSEALSYAKAALKLQAENDRILENDIPNLESAIEAAGRKIARLNEEVMSLKHDKKTVNKIRKTAEVLERANRSLIGDNTEADDQILENYREHVNTRRIRAQGSEVILSKLPSEQIKTLDDKILSKEAEDFLKTL